MTKKLLGVVGLNLEDKFVRLKRIVRETDGIAIAFSGGVDSTFLAAVAQQELGDKAVAVTALSPTYPEREQKEACGLATRLGIRHVTKSSNELAIEHFAENPTDRCYYCKAELFAVVKQVARENNIHCVADGTNADDVNDYRPGRRASEEKGVMAPLLEAGLGKEDIRELSRRLDLPTSEKPAFACLASRFPYGSRITAEKLSAVDALENVLRDLGFAQIRVRHHGDIARIEVEEKEIERIARPEIRTQIINAAKRAGFLYVAVDLKGYRTGSMNEGLEDLK